MARRADQGPGPVWGGLICAVLPPPVGFRPPRPGPPRAWISPPRRPPAAATFAAPAALIKLSTGPVVAVVLFLALVGARAGRVRIAAFVGLLAVELAVLWLALGQSFADLPAFLHRTVEVAGSYSTAMLR